MNCLTVFLLVASTLAAAAQSFQVRCPTCLKEQTLVATSIQTNGGASTNKLGVVGTMETRTANFHCPECHADFTAPVKPDRFVPLMSAVEVSPTPHVISPPGQLRLVKVTPTITTNYVDEIVRTVLQPDGSELIVIRRTRR